MEDFCPFLGMSFSSVLSVSFHSVRVYLCPDCLLSFLMCIFSQLASSSLPFSVLCLILNCVLFFLCWVFPVLLVQYNSLVHYSVFGPKPCSFYILCFFLYFPSVLVKIRTLYSQCSGRGERVSPLYIVQLLRGFFGYSLWWISYQLFPRFFTWVGDFPAQANIQRTKQLFVQQVSCLIPPFFLLFPRFFLLPSSNPFFSCFFCPTLISAFPPTISR